MAYSAGVVVVDRVARGGALCADGEEAVNGRVAVG